MTMDLYLWKRPVTTDEDEAGRLLRAHHDGASVFAEDDPDVDGFVTDVEAAAAAGDWPWEGVYLEHGLVSMSFSWSVSGEALDEVVDLARRHDLVLYDPQGPSIHRPESDEPATPTSRRAELTGVAKTFTIGIALLALGWWMPVPLVGWFPMILGAMFVGISGWALLGILVPRFGPGE